MTESILFIYGTLKRGQPANYLLRDATFLGEAITVPRYRLYDLGPYPGLVEVAEEGMAIHGELWAVPEDLLGRLDEYEGVPGLYERNPILLDEDSVQAQSYFYRGRVFPEGKIIDKWD